MAHDALMHQITTILTNTIGWTQDRVEERYSFIREHPEDGDSDWTLYHEPPACMVGYVLAQELYPDLHRKNLYFESDLKGYLWDYDFRGDVDWTAFRKGMDDLAEAHRSRERQGLEPMCLL